jgi:hypothetical protein
VTTTSFRLRGIPEHDREGAVELRERLRGSTVVALGDPGQAVVEIADEVYRHAADEQNVAIGGGPYHRDSGGPVEGGEPSESARGDADHMRGLCWPQALGGEHPLHGGPRESLIGGEAGRDLHRRATRADEMSSLISVFPPRRT